MKFESINTKSSGEDMEKKIPKTEEVSTREEGEEVLDTKDTLNEKVEVEETQETEDLLSFYEMRERKQLEYYRANPLESGAIILELEELLASSMNEELLLNLNAIETEEDARNSEERETAKITLVPIFNKLRDLKNKTEITDEDKIYKDLYGQYKILSNAVGFINNGVVDHTR